MAKFNLIHLSLFLCLPILTTGFGIPTCAVFIHSFQCRPVRLSDLSYSKNLTAERWQQVPADQWISSVKALALTMKYR